MVACSLFLVNPALAETAESNNFKVIETSIGPGSLLESSSPNFKTRSGVGDLSVGQAESGNFQIEAGSVTTGDPYLEFSIDDASAGLGNFTATDGTTGSATFSIRNFTSYGYVVTVAGTPPKNGSETIEAMTTTGSSQAGTEQFGINLVANTSPDSIGANPVQQIFGVGQIAPNYATPNQYRFVAGETIATAPKSSGKTTYTISYLVNVESITPGGQYNADQTLIVTGTY